MASEEVALYLPSETNCRRNDENITAESERDIESKNVECEERRRAGENNKNKILVENLISIRVICGGYFKGYPLSHYDRTVVLLAHSIRVRYFFFLSLSPAPFHFLFPFSFFFSMSAVRANHTGRFSRGRRRKIREKKPNRIPTLLTFISPMRIFSSSISSPRLNPADNGSLKFLLLPSSNFSLANRILKPWAFAKKWKMKKKKKKNTAY